MTTISGCMVEGEIASRDIMVTTIVMIYNLAMVASLGRLQQYRLSYLCLSLGCANFVRMHALKHELYACRSNSMNPPRSVLIGLGSSH